MHEHVIKLCELFKERAIELGLRGKRRDDDAITYFIGAAQGLSLAGNDEASARVASFAMFGIAFRGYKEIEKTLKESV